MDAVQFNIPGTGVHTIAPASPLATGTSPIVIDGTTQPGYSGSALIRLLGSSAGASTDGLSITAGASTVRGLRIAGFGGNGIALTSNGGNIVESNEIGEQSAPIGQAGVLISSSNNRIGGPLTSQGNTNAFSGTAGDGVLVASGTGNSIVGNLGVNGSIDPLAIDLGGDGKDFNDAQDTDSGPNDRQNYPVLSTVSKSGTMITTIGTLNSTPNATFTLHFYRTAGACDVIPGSTGGNVMMGSTNVTTNSNGDASFTASFVDPYSTNDTWVDATATNSAGSTSEFAGCRGGHGGTTPTPTPTATASPTITPSATPTGLATENDFPNADKNNQGAYTNHLGTLCGQGSVSTTCSSAIDEDIGAPNDSDYVQSVANPTNGFSVEFELTDAPPDLQKLDSVTIRFRASKVGGKQASALVQLNKADGTQLNPATVSRTLTQTETTFTETANVSSFNLNAAAVDGLFLRVFGSVSGGGSQTTVRFQTIDVEKQYSFAQTPTPTPTSTPPATPTPTSTATPTPTQVDSDGDTWSDQAEGIIGTNPRSACGVDAWPADINNDGFVDVIGDISRVTGAFGQSVPPAPARYDIAPDPPDQYIDVINDIVRLTGLFGHSCG